MDCYFTPYTKIISKCIKKLIKRPGSLKLLEENVGEKLHDIGVGNDFSNKTTKKTKSKCDYIKLKRSCTAKETINTIKRKPKEWEKYL